MKLEATKQHLIQNRYQIVQMDEAGRLVSSCNTLLDLSGQMGQVLPEVIPAFAGMLEGILSVTESESPMVLPLLEYEYQDTQYRHSLEFHKMPDYEGIIMLIGTYQELRYKLQQIQQERNESIILLEKIKDQQELLQAYTSKLESVNRGLDRFAYIVSHDLKSPLRAIHNLSEWIAEGIDEEDYEEVPDHIRLLQNRIGRMENLIDGILHYSRAGREKTANEVIQVADILHEVLETENIPQDFTVILPDNLPALKTPRTSLYQVFANLFTNAVKYGRGDTNEIRVGCKELEDFWEFSVADAGPGIDPQFHEQVFEIFQTLQSKDTIESTGIGLTIVKKIITDLGGDIWVESSPGKGADFHFTWPKTIAE